MRVLLDANIIITYLTQRADNERGAVNQIFQYLRKGKLEGYVAFSSLASAWYVMRHMDVAQRRKGLQEILDLLQVAAANTEAVRQAAANDAFPDFEDNLQDCCAKEIHADYIVTANLKDFVGHSQVPAITPAGLLDLLQLQSLLQTPPSPGEVRESPSTYYYTHIVVTRLLPGSPEGHRHFLKTA